MNNKFINVFLPIALFVVVMAAMASFFVEVYMMGVTPFAWYSISIGGIVSIIYKVIHNYLIKIDELVNVTFFEEFTKK